MTNSLLVEDVAGNHEVMPDAENVATAVSVGGGWEGQIEAIIFDLDGTLVDSEPLWHRAEKVAFESVGIRLSEEDCCQTNGMQLINIVEFWYQRYPWDVDATPKATVLQRLMVAMLHELRVGTVLPKPGSANLVARLKEKGIRIGVATNCPFAIAQQALRGLGFSDAFEAVCSSEHEKYPKPHPQVYMSCCEKLGVDPSKCIAVEDSLTGVISAKAARMKCIAVPEAFPCSEKFKVADLLVRSLDEVTFEALEALVATR